LAAGKGLELNLGTGYGFSVQQVIDAAERVTGRKIRTVAAPRRAGDPAELVADSSLAQRTLHWKPKYVEIEPLVETAWKWHVRHPKGYGDA
jgi:UDP-glucose 4-epimerase